MNNSGDVKASDSTPSPKAAFRWEWLLVWASFALIASIRAPIPGVNEPHYFTKARHFWDPTWCARDPFLQSANAHYVFYATFGLLTKFFSFDQAALIGRLIGWGLLASGWCALAARLSPARWFGLKSAWIFLGLATIGNLSGEWVVGGIEAKVISYGCAWWSLASLIAGKRIQAAAWAGLAVSFHPVVGIWHTGALFLATISMQVGWLRHRGASRPESSSLSPIGDWGLSAVVWLLLSAPGLIPAIAMIREANVDDSYAADYIQVFHRLNHHLDPLKFRIDSYVFYGILIALIFAVHVVNCFVRFSSRVQNLDATGVVPATAPAISATNESVTSAGESLLFRYVVIAVVIALGGLLLRASPKIAAGLLSSNTLPAFQNQLQAIVEYENRLPKWLKFYPFRLADVFVPLLFAMQAASCLTFRAQQARATEKTANRLRSSQLSRCTVLGLICFGTIYGSCIAAKNDSRLRPEAFADWRDVCNWLREETPRDALCFVPAQAFGLKWYAERAEYVSHKDCPQDAAGIVAWNKRFVYIAKWSKQQTEAGYSKAMLHELREKTGIDYVITPIVSSKLAAFPIEPVYQNPSYLVFKLDDGL
jgi:hypothetical protein